MPSAAARQNEPRTRVTRPQHQTSPRSDMSQNGSPSYQDAVKAREHEVEGHISHGHSAAGWTGTALGLLGTLIASVAMVFAFVPGFWIGIVVMLAGIPAVIVMNRMGLGQKQHPDQHGKPTPVR